MVTLQQHFSSMEETVRTLLQNQDSLEGPKVDPLDLMKAYKDKLLEEMWKQQDSLEGPTATAPELPASPEAGGGSEDNSKDSNPLLERLRALEAENSALSMENDNQRKQYERCLDEVANQVVQALLTQKDLKEECVKLRTRVFDLEQQNRILSMLFQQRVKMSSAPVSQEVQRNGKAGIPAGRWPSLLSLTCPRSSGSGSGSELSLSSACSEYSSGSHTWAEGRGFSKQCAGRDKRMSTGSVSSNHSAAVEPSDLGWKEGHILKGLKRLQMSTSKEASSAASVPHCKDCMTSNEGIYSLGVKGVQQGVPAKQPTPASKALKAAAGIAALDSDQSGGRPASELLCLEKLDIAKDVEKGMEEDPVKLSGNSGLFHSPVTDNFLFLDGPSLQPGVSPTDGLTQPDQASRALKFSDRNNNQERSTDRKSRLDQVRRQQGRIPGKPAEAGTGTGTGTGNGNGNGNSGVQLAATRALSCVNEARQRSSSMEVPHCRDQASQAGGEGQDQGQGQDQDQDQDHTVADSPQRKPKPQACDSARKAFILRSKSADGGQEPKHTHSPLHQKLIKGHRSKGQSSTSPAGHGAAGKRTNPSKPHGSGKGTLAKAEKDEDSAALRSPLASPVKQSKGLQPHGGAESPKSPTESSPPVTGTQSSSDSAEESLYDNLPCSPRKQRRQEQQRDVSQAEGRRSPSPTPPPPPPPPGRGASLLLRPAADGFPKEQKAVSQPCQIAPVPMQQQPSAMTDSQSDSKPTKDAAAKIFHGIQPKMPIQETHITETVQLPADITTTCRNDSAAHCVLPNQSVLQRSQQSISEPKLSEVLPPAYSNVYYHGMANNPQSSTSRAVKRTFPVNAKSHEAIGGQDTNTFLVFGRHSKEEGGGKGAASFQTFTCDPQMIQDKGRRKIETRCSSLDSEPPAQPAVTLDWGFDEEGWLFKRSVSVSTRPPLKPVMGMNGAKARSQSFGARYMDRPSFNRSGKVRTQIKTHSGSSLNSLGDVLPGSMSCSSSYHCPMNRSLLNNFLLEEGLAAPQHLASSSERLQSLKLQREQARRLQIEQQFSSAFGEPVSEEPERQSAITTIEEKVMLGIEENLHKSQEQERGAEVKQKAGSGLASWFGFRKSKLPAPGGGKKAEPPKAKEDKKEQKITSLLGGKHSKLDKKRDRRKSDGKDSSVGRRESHDAVRACISMPCPGMSLSDMQGHADATADPKTQMMQRRADGENGSTVKSPTQEAVIGSGCKMRTLDSGIGTIPLPESCSFFSSILHFLPKSSSTPEQSLGPPGVPGSSGEDASPSPLPRWRIPAGRAGVPGSLSDSSVTRVRSVPFPTVAFLQPVHPPSRPVLTSQSRLPRPPPELLQLTESP